MLGMVPSEGVVLAVVNAVTATVASFFCLRMVLLPRFQRLPNASLTVLLGCGAAMLWTAALYIAVGFQLRFVVTRGAAATPFCKFQGGQLEAGGEGSMAGDGVAGSGFGEGGGAGWCRDPTCLCFAFFLMRVQVARPPPPMGAHAHTSAFPSVPSWATPLPSCPLLPSRSLYDDLSGQRLLCEHAGRQPHGVQHCVSPAPKGGPQFR